MSREAWGDPPEQDTREEAMSKRDEMIVPPHPLAEQRGRDRRLGVAQAMWDMHRKGATLLGVAGRFRTTRNRVADEIAWIGKVRRHEHSVLAGCVPQLRAILDAT